jgi:nitroreductase
VWTSIYPTESWIAGFKSYVELPENIVPFAILPVGYPDEVKEPEDRYKSDRIHWGKW